MDIHKPKAWHSVREFLKEYLIIVVGVLTALAAEAVVEQLHWRHQIEVAHGALAYDLKRVLGWSGVLDAEAPCIAARLATLDAVLDKAQESGRLTPLGPISKPRENSWNLRAWSGLTYGQTLAHIPNAEQTHLAGLARLVDWMFASDLQEYDNWSRLQRMSGTGRRTNDAEIAALRETVASERGLAAKRRGGAGLAEAFVVDTGLLSRAEIERAWRQGVDSGGRAAICKPVPPAPAQDLMDDRYLRAPLTPPSASGYGYPDDVGVRGESLK
jgi:hypothetical protein